MSVRAHTLLMRMWQKSHTLWLLGAVVFFVGVYALRPYLQIAYEDVLYVFAPTAERAYTYGEWHFSESVASTYDLPRAEYFLIQAAHKNPNLPYVYHELARIEFLRGNFTEAMRYINIQIARQGAATPNSFYIRALIEGYMGKYEESAADYQYFLAYDPHNWAAANDCAWVLIQAGNIAQARSITEKALIDAPDNPWLLTMYATELYQLGDQKRAKEVIAHAAHTVATLTDDEWSHAYPGNDPHIAPEGVASFKEAVHANMRLINAVATSSVE